MIDYSEKVIGLRDTNYVVSSIPASVNTMIYIEDLTGVRCNNCPKAADKIKEIKLANPAEVVSLGVYPSALTTLMKPWPGFEALITNEADDIFAGIYKSPSFIPTGGVNRKIFVGETSVNVSYNKWSGYADTIKATKSPVIIESQLLSFDNVTLKARVRVKVIFSKAVVSPLNISVYLSESKILSKQLMPDGSLLDTYEHNHALRKAITTYSGLPLKINATTTGNYEAGRTFEKDFEVQLSPNWKKDNCTFIFLVNRSDNDSKEVLQAAELELK